MKLITITKYILGAISKIKYYILIKCINQKKI